jgi:hypothetical protein
VSRRALPTAERWRRYVRDRAHHRRESLWRRSHGPRFYRYLGVIPEVFLVRGALHSAPLAAPAIAVVEALRGRVTWTLDTAARLRFGVGLLRAGDVTGYAGDPGSLLDDLAAQRLVGPRIEGAPSLDPVVARPPVLVLSARSPGEPRRLDPGDLVVADLRLVEDIFGTVGFRPDLLARLEARGLEMRRT